MPGCSPVKLRLRPYLGKRYHLEEILDSCHSVLLRIPVELHAVLDGGSLRVSSGGKLLGETPLPANCGAVLLGREVPTPADHIEKWRLELAGKGLDGASIARSLNLWMNPVHSDLSGIELSAKPKLSAEFVSEGGKPLAHQEVLFDAARFQDVSLESFR